jgi:hypothetical protein
MLPLEPLAGVAVAGLYRGQEALRLEFIVFEGSEIGARSGMGHSLHSSWSRGLGYFPASGRNAGWIRRVKRR